jgi:hypothetical protein
MKKTAGNSSLAKVAVLCSADIPIALRMVGIAPLQSRKALAKPFSSQLCNLF